MRDHEITDLRSADQENQQINRFCEITCEKIQISSKVTFGGLPPLFNPTPGKATPSQQKDCNSLSENFSQYNSLKLTMGFTTAAIGGFLGFTAQCMSNAIQKIPLSRRKSAGKLYGIITPLSFCLSFCSRS
jgi:hypothetical protein